MSILEKILFSSLSFISIIYERERERKIKVKIDYLLNYDGIYPIIIVIQ